MIRDWNDPKYCLEAVKRDAFAIRFVKNQTPEMCLQAVKRDGLALRFVIDQTFEICLVAVKENGHALRSVKDQTPEICLDAVKQYGLSLRFVKNQTPLIIHYLKKYNMLVYKLYKEDNRIKKENRITISQKEMEKFYNENPHLLLTL